MVSVLTLPPRSQRISETPESVKKLGGGRGLQVDMEEGAAIMRPSSLGFFFF